jgi:hypothetical protein
MTEFDPEQLLATLVKAGVEFVLVGGYAAVLHGASRPTEDLDITPATTFDNLTKLAGVLKSLRARIRTDAVPDGLPFDTSAEAMQGLLMLNLTTRFGDLDIAFRPSGTGGLSRPRRPSRRLGGRRHHDQGRFACGCDPIQGGRRTRQGRESAWRAVRALANPAG